MKVLQVFLLYCLFFLLGNDSNILSAEEETSDKIIVYTEDYPPFNFVDPNSGHIVGYATEKVRSVLEKAGLEYEIRMLPWKRAIRSVKSNENALIYTLVRTPVRESMYRWLVPIAPADFYVFMRADDLRVPTYEALRAGDYTASCVAQDITCDLLIALGIPPENITAVPNDQTGDFSLTMAGRTDIFLSDSETFKFLRDQESFDINLIKQTLRVNIKTGFYLAGNLNMPEVIWRRIIAANKILTAND
jgi:polar amino acid transport system substrate-binding protein